MSVWYRQVVGDEVLDGPRQVAPHAADQTDGELLAAKASGAANRDWTVEWTSPTSFTATKTRWGNEAQCVREFWVAD